jgi:hypothetical protein
MNSAVLLEEKAELLNFLIKENADGYLQDSRRTCQ